MSRRKEDRKLGVRDTTIRYTAQIAGSSISRTGRLETCRALPSYKHQLDTVESIAAAVPECVPQLSEVLEGFNLVGNQVRQFAVYQTRRAVLASLTKHSYRGLRHASGLPVRGQRTHNNCNTRRRQARLHHFLI